jgi:hypothetical protein
MEKKKLSCPCQGSYLRHPAHCLVAIKIIKNETEEGNISMDLYLICSLFFGHICDNISETQIRQHISSCSLLLHTVSKLVLA